MSIFCRTGLLSLLLSSTLLAGAAEPPPKIVMIGYAGTLAEINAKNGRNAARIAIDEANKSNPRINGQAVTFQLLEQDDKADPRTTEYVARFLADSSVIGVVGHWTSAATMAAAPISTAPGWRRYRRHRGVAASRKTLTAPRSRSWAAMTPA